MKRYALVIVATVGLLAPTSASAARVKYSGTVDATPTASVKFTIKKRNGKKKIVNPSFQNVPAECSDANGEYDGLLSVDGNGSAKVRRKEFKYRENVPFVYTFYFDGKLKAGGKAEGTLEFFGDVQGGSYCDTGEQAWSAHKR